MNLIKSTSNAATNAGWKVKGIPDDILEKAGYERGVELTSPDRGLTLEVMDSVEEVFCNFGNYARIDASVTCDDSSRTKLFNVLEDIFKYGVTIEVFKRGAKIVRSTVAIGSSENRRIIAKTVNGVGLFWGRRKHCNLDLLVNDDL